MYFDEKNIQIRDAESLILWRGRAIENYEQPR